MSQLKAGVFDMIKSDPELRHVLAHLIEAIRMSAKGDEKASLYELESIEGLILFDDEEDFRRYVNGMSRSKEEETASTKETSTETEKED